MTRSLNTLRFPLVECRAATIGVYVYSDLLVIEFIGFFYWKHTNLLENSTKQNFSISITYFIYYITRESKGVQ